LRSSEIGKLVDSRINEFKRIGKSSNPEIFSELCFCLLTANFSAERGIKIQKEMGSGFLTLSEKRLSEKLRELGHRYPNARAKYIIEARRYKNSIKDYVRDFTPYIQQGLASERSRRDWLVKNIKGLGYKESSHFLRNIGYDNCAIIDFHIIDLLEKYKLINRPKILTRTKYLEIEEILKKVAKKSSLTLAELDLYLWFTETGKVLK